MAKKKVGIIGGGMSGLVAAILLAREGCKVTVFERNNKIGKKLLVTGNGRCNLSNQEMNSTHFHSMSKNIFNSVYSQFDLKDTKSFFSSIGIDMVELEEGKLYPLSLQAKSVVFSLLSECEHLGVEIIYNTRVTDIQHDRKFRITTDERTFYVQHLVVATGGKSYSDSGSSGDGYEIGRAYGHSVTNLYPSIVQFRTNFPYNKELKGLKLDCQAQLFELNNSQEVMVRKDSGEVLFTEYGLSGPTILQLSSKLEPGLSQGIVYAVELDLMPIMLLDELDEYLMKRLHQLSYRNISQALNGFINQRLIRPLLHMNNINPEKKAGDVSKVERSQLTTSIKKLRIQVEGTYLWNQAQVTKGGIKTDELAENTLESKFVENLYFIGEVVDMDGDCGGYNLQWATSSAAACAKGILSRT